MGKHEIAGDRAGPAEAKACRQDPPLAGGQKCHEQKYDKKDQSASEVGRAHQHQDMRCREYGHNDKALEIPDLPQRTGQEQNV